MKKPNITPGPWIAGSLREGYHPITNRDATLTIATAPMSNMTGTHKANARLIAAAPQLAEALERLIAHVQEYRETGHMSGWDKGFKDAQTALLAAGYTE